MQEELHCTCQACSPERKRSTSAGRKGSKGLKHTSCFLRLHWLQHSLHLQARGLCTGLSCWVMPAPEDAVGKEQTSSSLLVPPQLPQHPFVLAVGSGSAAPMGLSATEAGSFPTDTSGPVPLAEGFGMPLRPRPLGTQNTGILSLRTASRSSSRVSRT